MMARSSGRNLKIQFSDGATDPAYTTIASVRTKTFTVNDQNIDVTTDDDSAFQTLLEDSGGMSLEASVSGLTDDDALLTKIMSGRTRAHAPVRILRPNGSYFTGNFRLAPYTETGEYQDSITFDATLSSSGAFTFTPAA
jgi:predicted secreted protein